MSLRQLEQCLLVCVVSFWLAACGNSMHVQVEESRATDVRSSAPASNSNASYTVKRGDTLYSIAWQNNLDFRKLAAANNITPPYLIRPGDIIHLREAPAVPARQQASAQAVSQTVAAAQEKKPEKTGQGSEKNVERKQPVRLPASSSENWMWPVNGKIGRHFSEKDLTKGIDIIAEMGTPIKAVRSGQVVYAGSRLQGYGQLIIVRHDDRYLSAYAHNRKILVEEGQMVKQGDTIAELGASGTQSPKLYFEIRRNGKPVNPLGLLPDQA